MSKRAENSVCVEAQYNGNGITAFNDLIYERV